MLQITLFVLRFTRDTKRPLTWDLVSGRIALALPYAGITQVRFRGSAASVGPQSQPGSPGPPSSMNLCAGTIPRGRGLVKQAGSER